MTPPRAPGLHRAAGDGGALPLPACGSLQAEPSWAVIDLLSDVHLSADMPLTFAAWRHHLLNTPADAVLMLGDLFEVWLGDDASHSGFEAECLQVLQAASARRMLAFMPGNRDFLVGPALLAEASLQGLTDPTLLQAFGQRWLLSHGDALCLADTAYQQFRTQVRSAGWQQAFLAQALPERQAQARAMRAASMAHQARQLPADWADVDDAAAAAWLAQAQAPVMVHGHTHRPAQHLLAGGTQRHVLGDWDLDQAEPAQRRARILRLTAQGLQTLDLAAPGDPAASAA